jgi:hypothetical protein
LIFLLSSSTIPQDQVQQKIIQKIDAKTLEKLFFSKNNFLYSKKETLKECCQNMAFAKTESSK